MSNASTWPNHGFIAAYSGKRVADFILAGVACLVFTPIVVAVAILVWLEDRDVPWFLQSRIGRDRRPFTIVKLRTMRDGHVTHIGRWLRLTGLDELPQFVNVLRGEMSIVGPRPLTPRDIERLGWHSAQHDWRFATNPGITGIAQLLGGVNARCSRRLDRLYLRRQSMMLDFKLIGLSFVANVFGKRVVRQ